MTRKNDFRMVHKLIRETAMEMAGAYYEFSAHDDKFYKYFPKEKLFINREWPRFVRTAKEVLTEMLNRPYPESHKQQIYDALLQTSTLPYSVQEQQIVNVPH